MIRDYEIVGNSSSLDSIKHSVGSIPKKIRQYILNSKPDHGCKINDHCLSRCGMGGHLASAIQEIIYAAHLNGRQHVKYQKGKEIEISPEATAVLQDFLRD